MADFGQEWLALREPADVRARSARLVEQLADWSCRQAQEDARPGHPLRVVDLGCGTGSNLRYLAPRLGARCGAGQSWRCLDHDEGLLAALPVRMDPWAAGLGLACTTDATGLAVWDPGGVAAPWTIRTQALDLAGGLAAVAIARGTLVTASALLDLVSETWMRDLLSACARASAPVLLALSYDGRVELQPRHPLDGALIRLVNAHQHRDKGFGPALGPDAVTSLGQVAAPLGFRVASAPSDWLLDRADTRLQVALIQSWIDAALEVALEAVPDVSLDTARDGAWGASGETNAGQAQLGGARAALAHALSCWQATRLEQIAEGRLRIRVGHRDTLLLPAGGCVA